MHRLILAFAVALVGVHRCHSFKQGKRRTTLPILGGYQRIVNRCHPRDRYCLKHLQSPLSIRGGTNDYVEDEYDDNMDDFIATFESELAEIRREAELDAENEMQKLRELIERRGSEVEEEDIDADQNEVTDRSEEIEALVSIDTDAASGEAPGHVVLEGEYLDLPPDDETAETTTEGNDGERAESSVAGEDVVTKEILHSGIEANEELSEDETAKVANLSDDGSNIEESNKEEVASREDEALQHDEAESPGIEADEELPEDETVKVADLSDDGSNIGESNKEEVASLEDEALQLDETESPVEFTSDVSDYSVNPDRGTKGFEAAAVGSTDDYDEYDSEQGEARRSTESHELGDVSALSDNEAINSVAITPTDLFMRDDDKNVVAEVILDVKPKKSKKRRKKVRKKGKKKLKARITPAEDNDVSDEIAVGLGESVVLTRTRDEIVKQPQSGIWFYLRSDLGRALCLFIATIILAITTQRLQRQMELDGN